MKNSLIENHFVSCGEAKMRAVQELEINHTARIVSGKPSEGLFSLDPSFTTHLSPHASDIWLHSVINLSSRSFISSRGRGRCWIGREGI